MKKIDRFVNQYPISKTLRFNLIPQGKTQENFENAKLLEEDEKRAEEYEKVKGYIDRYHKAFIERVLTDFSLPDLEAYSELYYKSARTVEEAKQLSAFEQSMRSAISNRLQKDAQYKGLFDKAMIREYLPSVLNAEEKLIADDFYSFTTYFVGFNENRRNMYTGEGHSTEIAFRIVDQNLPRFLDNCRLRERVLSAVPAADLGYLKDAFGVGAEEIFDLSFFHRAMRQSQIDIYNQIIGGYTEAGGIKKKGLNEYINEYNQKAEKKIPKLKPLYKQILSDRSSVSFIPEKFEDDNALLSALRTAYEPEAAEELSFKKLLADLLHLLHEVGAYDLSNIHVKSGAAMTSLSKAAFGAWDAVQTGLERQYDRENPAAKDPEKHREKREAYLKKIESLSLAQMQAAADEAEGERPKLEDWFASRAEELQQALDQSYAAVKPLLSAPYPADRKLCSNDEDIAKIKAFLDCMKDIQSFGALLLGSGKEAEKDELFYGEFLAKFDAVSPLTPLYDKVRNYVTQKPYSTDKIKLNFENPQLLGGWDKNKEQDYRCILLRKDAQYFLGIVAKGNAKVLEQLPEADASSDCYEKMEYKLLPGPNKMLPKVFFAKSNLEQFNPSARILSIRERESFKKGAQFNLKECHEFIDFFKQSIAKHEDWSKFGFTFSPTETYHDISEFYNEIKEQGYMLKFNKVPAEFIDSLVDDGQLFLFRLYNKDFSEHSHGTPNLHTMYFRELFSPENLKDVVFQLNGGAEMFYRRASIKEKDRIVHPANHPIENKNPLSEKKTSTFAYDMVKDRRFTVDKFFLHMPITLNFKAPGKTNLNMDVRSLLHEEKKSYVIGIDRGERNLLYICVVDPDGNLVEQHSLNEIVNSAHGQVYRTDYHALLNKREGERLQARKDWQTIEGIKELKEGYISQAVHVICQLMEKYDAVIAMEDLNFGFKNSRTCVEKQVYQKFEKMLIDKLNFYADKQRRPDEVGSIRNAYQLTNKFESFKKMGKQNGFIFYVPAWLTSKIDPTTGFVNLLKTRYESVPAAKQFFGNFDRIAFNKEAGWFEFDLDYSKFPNADTDYRKKWTVCSFGKRIETFRNPEKNSSWDTREIDLTAALHELFAWYGVDESADDLRAQILDRTEKDFFFRLMKLVSLMLQMRNSIPNSATDYLISPVRNRSGEFFCSNSAHETQPADADANGAYHIALKALWAIRQIAEHDGDLFKVSLAISNKQWLAYAQSRCE